MLSRLATLVPLALAIFLTGCAGQAPQQDMSVPQRVFLIQEPSHEDLAAPNDGYRLPALADDILVRGFGLLGTPYRYGGSSEATGFDCSGFIGYLFREEAGIKLPRSTREMISLDAPRVARSELAPGDLIFFNNRGRGRVNHVGVYIGNGRFLHSASRRSGGVRVDSLNDGYWSASYLQAKRALVLALHNDVQPEQSTSAKRSLVLASHND
ncbi:C40 family peptidase [Azotobacter armeniacus]